MDSPGNTGFTGIKAEGLAFLKDILILQEKGDFEAARNYFIQNKTVHELELKGPLGDLVEELGGRFRQEGTPLRGDRKNSLFRINRDVRFSPDKSPYKTHSGAVLSRGGTRKEQGVLYVHIDPAGCLMAAGFYRPEPGQLAKLRDHMRDNPKKLKKMIEKLAASGLELDTDESLKRLPRGFEDVADPEVARVVKLKGLTVMAPLKTEEVMDSGLADKLVRFAHQIMPLLEFGWEALDRAD
jgi:uncharacterized protein (TIGR02453 family)